ncbi:MAG TPA: type II toxin-antitoxin system HicB family antitoxin [Fimbriimonadaceae bacterium]|nr:type II toxin-antitoxin system HicB family antitoxin [Fimbriimonadaceae bacterium]
MVFRIELEEESDGRWIAEVPEIPGALAYGLTPSAATQQVQVLALRAIADKLEHGETEPYLNVSFIAA